MLDLTQVKTLLRVAGITQLKIGFDGELQIVNAEYIFKGVPGHKQITWEEIIDCLTFGNDRPMRLPTVPTCPAKDSDR